MGIFEGIKKEFFKGEKEHMIAGAFETIIGEKSRFKGELNAAGAVRIDGEFEGKLVAEGDLIISPGSKLIGEVRGGSVVVAGRVDGNIAASHCLEITKSGRVHGDLVGGKIIIEEGSSYQGKVKVAVEPPQTEIVQEEPEPAREWQPSL